MEQLSFGQLLGSLRREHSDAPGKFWTQKDLAEKAGLSKRTIERLEEDTLKKLEVNLLRSLAETLNLTTMERKEFFLAALGLDHSDIAAEGSLPTETLEHLISTLAHLRVPAFIYDAYSDILAANESVLQLMLVPPELMALMKDRIAGFNLMQIVFGPDLQFHKLVGVQWETSARYNMQIFRSASLRYRHRKYFQKIFQELYRLPNFRRYWEHAPFEDHDRNVDNVSYMYKHPSFGMLNYQANITVSYTKAGELYLVVYLPLSDDTAALFEQFYAENKGRTRRFAPWPEK